MPPEELLGKVNANLDRKEGRKGLKKKERK